MTSMKPRVDPIAKAIRDDLTAQMALPESPEEKVRWARIQALAREIMRREGSGETTVAMAMHDAVVLDELGILALLQLVLQGGRADRELYDPALEEQCRHHPQECTVGEGPILNDHYGRLQQLGSSLRTTTGRRIAEFRRARMAEFLHFFWREADGLP